MPNEDETTGTSTAPPMGDPPTPPAELGGGAGPTTAPPVEPTRVSRKNQPKSNDPLDVAEARNRVLADAEKAQLDEVEPGGCYEVDGRLVNAHGEPLDD
jgi:hypothetical protein